MSITKRVLNIGSSSPSFEALDVSLEEEVLAAGEAQNELLNAEAESGEVERLQDVADQTAQSVDYIEAQINTDGGEGATENEVALAEQVANLATVGTGEDADTVMPSSENYVGSQISCEGLKETVKSIIRAVIDAIKKLWLRLKKFWKATMSRLSSLKKSAQELKERANKTTGTAKEKKIKVSGSISSILAIDGTVQKDFGQLNSGLKDLEKRIKESGEWTRIIGGAGEHIADFIGDVDGEKAAAEEASFATKFSGTVKNLHGQFTGLSSSSDKRFADSKVTVKATSTLLGEKRIFERSRNNDGSAGSNIREKASIRVFLDSSSDKVKDQSETEFNTIGPANVADLADEIVSLVDAMAYYGEGKGLDKAEKAASKVEKALDKLGRGNDAEEAKGENAAALRRIISLGHAFNDWARNPGAALVNHTCTVARAILTVGTRSLAQF